MASRKLGRLIASTVILVGAVLLVAALLMPWYSIGISGNGASETGSFYPGTPSSNGTVRYSCSSSSGGPNGSSPCPTQESYSSADLNNTGTVAETGFFLLVVGGLLGAAAGAIGLTTMSRRDGSAAVLAIATVALVVAVAAPGLFAASLPGAISKDTPGASGSGPWSSFYGSSSNGSGTPNAQSFTWGPGLGWYLSFGAFAVLLVGLILYAKNRRDPPEPLAPVPTPSTEVQPSGAPAPPPPVS
jgi:hypothetical protein